MLRKVCVFFFVLPKVFSQFFLLFFQVYRHFTWNSLGFVENGANVILSSRDSKVVTEAASALSKLGPGSCRAIPANLARDEECKRVAEEISRLEGRLDVLVNNAGANWGAPLDSYPDDAWDKVLALNVKSVFHLTKHCTSLLAASSTGGRVINLGSIDGLRVPQLETYAYSASKAAVHHLTRTLANKLADKNITVNAIAAGAFETKMMAATLDQFRDIIVASIPLGRTGRTTDIAGTCLYFASRAGAWTTGTVLVCDGGAMVRSGL
eukprot:TRINITY_DN1819_c0_g1_i1.p1 TRINITY_DN1819_c0_g1~~TRINITY_DN1819_c0_g1_i1.p1  ORF type:complete len:266 (+),score=29.17 TRINITY_DN1819_c0_g1_i1:231-1028(+)